MDVDDIYANVQSEGIQDSTGPQTWNHNQDEEKGRKQGSKSRCMLVMTVSLGLICVLLLLFITLQHISITAERDLYKNTVEELNHTISSLQHNNIDLKIEKQQLKNNLSTLSLEKLKLERNITTLKEELKKAYNICFFISTNSKTWSESRRFCRDQGGDLVIINTEAKQMFITSIIKERMWIGLSDTESEGNMKWVDNSPLNQGFWSKGEPNNYEGVDEDCVEVRPQDTLNNWNDLPCSIQRQGICEK